MGGHGEDILTRPLCSSMNDETCCERVAIRGTTLGSQTETKTKSKKKTDSTGTISGTQVELDSFTPANGSKIPVYKGKPSGA